MAARDASIDIAKAIAIVAIVFGHVWRGLDSAGQIGDAHLFAVVDTTVYMSHLTVFAFTAGLFVPRGMQRDGPWAYARDRDVTFLWLYVLWSVIQGLVKVAAGSVVNTPKSLTGVLEIWYPEGQLWFFGWIALMMVLTALLQPWRSRARAALLVGIALVGSLAAWGLNGQLVGTLGLGITIYFVVGALYGGGRLLALLSRIPGVALAAIFVVGMSAMLILGISELATPPTTDGETRTVVSVILGVVGSTAGLAAVLAVSRLISQLPGSRRLAFVGEQSLQIFVAHIVFAAGTRIVLVRLGVDSLVLQAILGTLAGVIGPLALYWLAARFRLLWLFAAPRWLEHAVRGVRHDREPAVE